MSAVCRAASATATWATCAFLRPSSGSCCLCLPAATPRLLQEPSYGAPSCASDRALPHALAVGASFCDSVGAPSATPSACLQHAQAVSSRLWPREPLVHSGGALQRLRQRPLQRLHQRPFSDSVGAPFSDSCSVPTARLGSCVRSLCRTLCCSCRTPPSSAALSCAPSSLLRLRRALPKVISSPRP